jgi:curved DNA-binding protein CbpA
MSSAGDNDQSLSIERILEWDRLLDVINYYELLGVSDTVPANCILEAYHRFALTFHPDTHFELSVELRQALTRIFQRGVEAYQVLINPSTREEYGRILATGKHRYFDSIRVPKLNLEAVMPTLHERCRSAGAKLEAQQAYRHFRRNELEQVERRLANALRFDGNANPDVEPCLEAVRMRIGHHPS